MIKVYGMSLSGNCHKVRMILEALQLPYAWIEIDPGLGETRTAEFLARNPNGKVPVLEPEPGVYLAESNAILFYLAEGSPLVPSDRLARARVLAWLFFEQYSHEPFIAVARFLRRFHPDPSSQHALAESKLAGGYRALEVMEGQLTREPFMVGGHYTIADIALYAYTHVADEGGFDLSRFPAINTWLVRVAAQPGYVAMAAAA
ncbi:MAG TPA: glutathione S-transferase family protein [Casimicrobiaceae bacterium]|jgi:glutathione S-transferase